MASPQVIHSLCDFEVTSLFSVDSVIFWTQENAYVSWLMLKDMIKDADEDPGEGHTGWGLEGFRAQKFASHGAGAHHPETHECVNWGI